MKIRPCLLKSCAALAVLPVALALAQAPEPKIEAAPPVEELVSEALGTAPSLAVLRARLAGAREMV
ncbi:MAG: hypothetical protein MUO25_03085, partial [Thermoanaerobaculaceae bacterium]|nr:hypothetical protein [Thermoanaerobaculaceae bacterium]